MVAMKELLPDDPDDRMMIRRILDASPELGTFIQKVGNYAVELFIHSQIKLDTRQYDEWDAPLNMIITVPFDDHQQFTVRDRQFTSWIVRQPEYDPARLFVMILPHNMIRKTA